MTNLTFKSSRHARFRCPFELTVSLSLVAISSVLFTAYLLFSIPISGDLHVSQLIIARNGRDDGQWAAWAETRSLRQAHLHRSFFGSFWKQVEEGDCAVAKMRAPADTQEYDGTTKVVWLMSFPNSGTSFTIISTRMASNCSTATNYALEGDIRDEPGVPVVSGSDGENGPWFERIPNSTLCTPRYILTKTHCGGYCIDCLPQDYIETPRSFQIACQSGTKAHVGQSGEMTLQPSTYDSKLVKGAIRLVRNPLDNIVSRFHLEHLIQLPFTRRDNDTASSWPELFPRNNTGFQQWCDYMDSKDELRNLHWIDDKLLDALEGVPCKADFYRYVQWHNLASTTIQEMEIPSLTIHYSDYNDRLEETLANILHFLHLPGSSNFSFEPGKEYGDYYSKAQKKAIFTFLQEFATRSTWNELKRYCILPLEDPVPGQVQFQ